MDTGTCTAGKVVVSPDHFLALTVWTLCSGVAVVDFIANALLRGAHASLASIRDRIVHPRMRSSQN